jgi:hypothetical protein
MAPVWGSPYEVDTGQGVDTGLALLVQSDSEWGGGLWPMDRRDCAPEL